jgi:hypothetical protein
MIREALSAAAERPGDPAAAPLAGALADRLRRGGGRR